MEELRLKKEIVLQALDTFNEALDIMNNPKYEEIYKTTRDSAIQRFEYTIDSFGKFLKIYMQYQLGITPKVDSSKGILREAVNAKIITEDEFEQLIKGVTDRNSTSHIYKEEIAEILSFHLPTYYHIMHDIVDRITF